MWENCIADYHPPRSRNSGWHRNQTLCHVRQTRMRLRWVGGRWSCWLVRIVVGMMSDLSGVMCDVIDSDVSRGTVLWWVFSCLVSSIVPLRRKEHTSGPHRSRHFGNIVQSTVTKRTNPKLNNTNSRRHYVIPSKGYNHKRNHKHEYRQGLGKECNEFICIKSRKHMLINIMNTTKTTCTNCRFKKSQCE